MELYQESIIDLLCKNYAKNENSDKKNELKIKEDPKKGMFVQGITEIEVKNAKEVKRFNFNGIKVKTCCCN